MLRITKLPGQVDGREIVLEGRLVGPWVGELRRVLAELGSGGITLDLGGLSFAGTDGVALLRSLRNSGVEMTRPSGFLAALMGDDDGDRDDG
jgi:hypothetical protein